jgi:hypothetical protein
MRVERSSGTRGLSSRFPAFASFWRGDAAIFCTRSAGAITGKHVSARLLSSMRRRARHLASMHRCACHAQRRRIASDHVPLTDAPSYVIPTPARSLGDET